MPRSELYSMMIVLCCFLIHLPQLAFPYAFEAPMGPYWMSVTGIEKCPDEGSREMVFDFHLKKLNRNTAAIHGNIIFKRAFDRNIKIKVEASVWGNGGWRNNAHNVDLDKNGCQVIHSILGKIYENLWAAAGYNLTDPCNIPPNNYKLQDFVASNWYLTSLPIMMYGKYRTTLTLHAEDSQLLGCQRMMIEVTKRV